MTMRPCWAVAMIGMLQKPSEQSIKLLVSRCADTYDVNAGVMFIMRDAIDNSWVVIWSLGYSLQVLRMCVFALPQRPVIWLRGIVILDCAHAIGCACKAAMLTTVTFALTS